VRVQLHAGSRRRRRWKQQPGGLASARRPVALRPLGRLPSARPPAAGHVPGIKWAPWAGMVVLAAVAYFVFALVRPVSVITTTVAPRTGSFGGRAPALAWPGQGEAAVAVEGVGLLGARGPDRSTPIASLAKVMTADVVLRDHPLRGSGGGPQITVTPADAAAYSADVAAGESVVAVRTGERLTERQALTALLLPSGNNIATMLAAWDAGSQRLFVAKMNARARALGLTHTRYADAAGVQPGTTSTAADQVRLAMVAMAVPGFWQTVGSSQATLPVAGRVDNLDRLLGKGGIIGIKTGSTSQAGGCFLFAAEQQVAGRPITVVGAVLHQLAGAPQPAMIAAAFNATTRLLASSRSVLVRRAVIRRGALLGSLKAQWAVPVALRAASSASLVGWPGLPIRTTVATAPRMSIPVSVGERVGTAIVAAGQQRSTVALVAAGGVPGASLMWRMTHP
jgi:serine-type D-Ala-D-Ala carboxypeptidase (penicillin-binding protein 5/6)